MDIGLKNLLQEIWTLGEANDASAASRSDKMLNITPDTGEFLLLLVRALQAKRVLEIGTSNGYSTLWLAEAVRPLGGTVTTLELSPKKFELAKANVERSGLQAWIQQELANAGEFLRQSSQTFDLIFLDSERVEYPRWWPDLQRVLKQGGLMVVDNAVSHAQEIEPFVELVDQTSGYITSLVPLGKGEWLILKS